MITIIKQRPKASIAMVYEVSTVSGLRVHCKNVTRKYIGQFKLGKFILIGYSKR